MKLHIPVLLYRMLIAICASAPAVVYAAGMQTPESITTPEGYTTVDVTTAESMTTYASTAGNISFKIADTEGGVQFDSLSRELQALPAGSRYITSSNANNLSTLNITNATTRLFSTTGGYEFRIENLGQLNMSGAQSVGYGDNRGGTFMLVGGTTVLHNNNSLSFTGNSRYYSTRGNGGVFFVDTNDSLSFTQNNSVIFNANEAMADRSIGAGGAIYTNRGALVNFEDNAKLSFTGNKAYTVASKNAAYQTTYHFSGGAIYLTGTEDVSNAEYNTTTLSISGNTEVDFTGNEARSEYENHVAYNCFGGAIKSGDETLVSLTDNGKLTFDSNLAWSESRSGATGSGSGSGSVYGGAINVGLKANLGISGNTEVVFTKNQATSIGVSSSSYARGGAVYGNNEATLEFSGNTSLKFIENSANTSSGSSSSYSMAQGGAVYVGEGGTIIMAGNDELELRGNKATVTGSSSNAYGGAISGANIILSGNGSVSITDNVAQTMGGNAQGGALYGAAIITNNQPVKEGDITISGNGNVLIDNNAEIDRAGTRMRAIFTNGKLELSASADKEIRIKDTIYASGNVTLNADYTGSDNTTVASTGSVILDGSSARSNLETLLGREASTEELRQSRTSIFGATALKNGTLGVQNEACLMAESLSIDTAGGRISLDSGKMRTDAFTTNNNQTSIDLSGAAYALLTEAALGSNTTLEFSPAGEGQHIRLAGNYSADSLSISVDAEGLTEGSSYCLFTLAAGSSMEWNADKVSLTGSAAEKGSLVWNNGSLYLNYGVTEGGVTESILSENGRILSQEHQDVNQATAALLYTSEGSQTFTLTEDVTLSGQSITINGLVGYYEITSADADNQVSFTTKNVTNGAIGGTEGTYRLNLHHLKSLNFTDTLSSDNAGAIFLNNGSSGEIHNIGTVSFTGHDDDGLKSSMIRVSDKATLVMRNNGKVLIKDSFCANGGGISVLGNGQLELAENTEIEFSGNGRHIISNNGYLDYGGAIQTGANDSLVYIHDNGKVTFSNNYAAMGGAIYLGAPQLTSGGGKVVIADNKQVHFINNGKEEETSADGGAIYIKKNSALEITGNKDLTFRGNAAGSNGGAIYADAYSTTKIQGNETVVFEENKAYTGTAITVRSGADFSMDNNGDVAIRNNKIVERATWDSGAAIVISNDGGSDKAAMNVSLSNNDSLSITGNYGYGISMGNYGGSLKLQNNGHLLVSGNYTVDNNGVYTLKGMILSGSTAASEATAVSISAAAGNTVEFRDSVLVKNNVNLSLNNDYTDAEGTKHKQTGDILFTGAYTESTLKSLKGGVAGTSTEISASRTSSVETLTTLYGGRLRIEDGAVFKGHGLTVAEGSAATVLVKDATLDHTGYDLTFHSGTTLEIQGDSTINGNLIMKSGAALVADTASINLSGTTQLGENLSVTSRAAGAAMARLSVKNDGLSGKAKDAGLTAVTLTTGNKTYFISDVSLKNVELSSSNATVYTLTNVAVDSSSSFSLNGGSVAMHGAGSYDIGTATSLASGISLAEDWTGTVKLTGSTLANMNIDTLAKGANSTVELSGVKGYMSRADSQGGAKTYAANLILTNHGEAAAWDINNGYDGDSRTFSGKVSGKGDIVRSSSKGTVQNIIFSGDTSEWSGAFTHDVDQGVSNNATIITNLTFNGSAEINAEISTNGKGELNVTLDDANIRTRSNTVTVNKDMTVTSLTVTEGTSARILKTLESQSTSRIKSGAALHLGNAITLQGLDENDAMLTSTLLSAASITGGELTNLSIENTGTQFLISGSELDHVSFVSTVDSTLSLTQVNIGENCSFDVGAEGLIALSGATLSITLPEQNTGAEGLLLLDCSNLFHCSAEGDMIISLGMTSEELLAAGYSSVQVDFGSDVDYSQLNLSLDGMSYVGSRDGLATFTVVPEPATATLSLLALTAMLARRRRSRH